MKDKLIALSSSIMLLAACTNEYGKLEQIPFNDTILQHNYTDRYGLATGLLNIYIVYGKYPLADKNIPAGVCLTPQGLKRYKIQELLDKNPELINERSKEAANAQ